MIKADLKRLMSDYFAFAKNLDTSKVVILIIYKDNFLFLRPDLMEMNIIKLFLADQYKIEDLGSYEQFIEIKLEQYLETKIILLSQFAYIEKALEHANMLNLKLVHFPILSRISFCKNVNKSQNKYSISLYQFHVTTHM